MGVKQLWTLLTPVGRPVMLETMEGKSLAIDSSIWIYQFQATMRDKEGRALVNAHVLGFLRRICKLLFYGIKPVFVFDGGAPALKRNTITERKKRKSGAAASHARVAEKLLAAHMRREALNHARSAASPEKGKPPRTGNVIDQQGVFLEDLEGPGPSTPRKPKPPKKDDNPSSTSSKKKNKFHDHDPYRLPEIDLEAAIAAATRSAIPDPRLATEEELRDFIDAMRPEDFDTTSPAFGELPTEVQYEIIGDLRLKSRQTSHARLEAMLRSAPTPLDFSRAQIRNLQHRNNLTQQLLTTVDSVNTAGKVKPNHLTIPVRIASERNREYVLVKNEGKDGGWVLGIRDDGTQNKPIKIDIASDEEDDDSDMDMEEVDIPPAGSLPSSDPHLRHYQRTMALAAIGNRYSPKKLAPLTTNPNKKAPSIPLFTVDDNISSGDEEPNVDADLLLAMEESLETGEAEALRNAIEASKAEMNSQARPSDGPLASSSKVTIPSLAASTPSNEVGTLKQMDDSDDDMYVATPLQAESVILAQRDNDQIDEDDDFANFGQPSALLSPSKPVVREEPRSPIQPTKSENLPSVAMKPPSNPVPPMDPDVSLVGPSLGRATPVSVEKWTIPNIAPVEARAEVKGRASPASVEELAAADVSDEEMEEVVPSVENRPPSVHSEVESLRSEQLALSPQHSQPSSPPQHVTPPPAIPADRCTPPKDELMAFEDDILDAWSRTPSPEPGVSNPQQEDWDAAQEMDVHAEEGEFARFVSQMKGKDLDTVREEIDEEIRVLNMQKKSAMVASEDITNHMISQIQLMLRLFGIPYITAPMEAEAQCAALVELGLVEGVITDDSDVFLFGGQRVFKNMFNQSKTVECFLLSDLSRELGLDRNKLIRLAYLLGSDYVDGLPGVGPVIAMELLKEFPGDGGLHQFKDWWMKVQTGRDKEADTSTPFRKRFKKKYKTLHLHQDWPNPLVRDAYLHPTVDESEEPFKWGLPDLDGLRGFLQDELSWQQSKVDELLLPIIRKMGKRGQANNANKQGTLENYFDMTIGTGTYAPRKRKAYSSKRLQQVVSDFRKEQKGQSDSGSGTGEPSTSGEEDTVEQVYTKGKAKAVKKAAPKRKKQEPAIADGEQRKRKKTVAPRKKRKTAASKESSPSDRGETTQDTPPPLRVELRQRRPQIANSDVNGEVDEHSEEED